MSYKKAAKTCRDTAADTGDEAEDDDNLDAGFHEGTVHVDFYGGDTLVGACDGTAAVDVDDDGGLSGSATCTLEGNDDVLELSIEGSEDGGTISSPADSWTWTGTTADGVLHGAWEGEDGGGIRHVGFFDVGAD